MKLTHYAKNLGDKGEGACGKGTHRILADEEDGSTLWENVNCTTCFQGVIKELRAVAQNFHIFDPLRDTHRNMWFYDCNQGHCHHTAEVLGFSVVPAGVDPDAVPVEAQP